MATLYESYSEARTTSTSCYGVHWKWQTFTPQIGHTITSVFLYLRKIGSPGDLTVSIRATSGGVPTGSDLATGTLLEADIPSSEGLVEVALSEYALVADTKYAIIWRALDGDANNYVRTYMDANALYTRGTFGDSDDSGENWYDYGEDGYDVPFQEWGNPLGFPYSQAHLIS